MITDTGLELDPPVPSGDYLGCGQFPIHISTTEAQRRLEHVLPWLEPSFNEQTSRDSSQNPIRAIQWDMFHFFDECVERDCELAQVSRSSVKVAKTPSVDDHQLSPEYLEQPGTMQADAAKLIMKMLYGAQLVRYEQLWPICSIAREVSEWNRGCDKRLYRLICYVNSTLDHSLEAFAGDDPQRCHLMNYVDADYAGDTANYKSTTGGYFAIAGPNTFVPISAACKKQTCVWHSNTESEILAVEHTIRTEGLQILTFWEHVVRLLGAAWEPTEKPKFKNPSKSLEIYRYDRDFNPRRYFECTRPKPSVTDLIILEDNEVAIKIIKKCRSVALRHLPRTHKINIS